MSVENTLLERFKHKRWAMQEWICNADYIWSVEEEQVVKDWIKEVYSVEDVNWMIEHLNY